MAREPGRASLSLRAALCRVLQIPHLPRKMPLRRLGVCIPILKRRGATTLSSFPGLTQHPLEIGVGDCCCTPCPAKPVMKRRVTTGAAWHPERPRGGWGKDPGHVMEVWSGQGADRT
ncbi:hypothetical protein AOLI_G00266290 [Acnodon oligacanthus]